MKLNELINESITKVQLQDYLRRQKLMAIGNKDKIISDIIEHYNDDSNAILSGFHRDELIDVLNHFSISNTGNKQEMIDRIRKDCLEKR